MSFSAPKSWFDTFSPELYSTQDLQTSNHPSQTTRLSQSTQSQFFSTNLGSLDVESTKFFNESRLSFIQEDNDDAFQKTTQAELSFFQDNSQHFEEASEEMDIRDDEIVSTFYSAVSVDTQQQSTRGGSYFTVQEESQRSQQASATAVSIDDDDDEDVHSERSDLYVPASIMRLYHDVKENHSDWAFTSLIAGHMCNDWFPFCAYNNLKLGLLLSLVSINDESPPIAIIAVGQETSHANTIMNYVGKFADRFVTSTLADFDKTTVKPNDTVEAGPLLTAKGGVLSIGDWSRLNPKAVIKLLREIETGAVTTERVQETVPLECSIWSYWSNSAKIKKDSSSIIQFFNVFGIPIMIDDDKYEAEIIDVMLSSEDNDECLIHDKDMEQYLKYATAQRVTMDTMAEEMLNKYFKATRAARKNALSSKAFKVLKQFAESHAKLCLRNTVITCDVLAAINISEKYIRVFFERNSTSSPDEPKFNRVNDVETYQRNLYEWLECFIR